MDARGGQVDRPPAQRVHWSRNGLVLALPGALMLAVLTRWGLDRDPWLDEALSLAAPEQLAETYDRTAYTMATFYAQLAAWTIPSSELWWARVLPVLHAIGAVMVLGVVAARCYGRRVALWAALFLGSSWMMVRYGHELRAFAFVTLLVALGWLATDHLVEDPSRRRWMVLHFAVGVLAPLTHGMAAFAIAWQAVAVLGSRAGRRTWYAAVPGWAATVVVTLVLYRIGGDDLGTPARPADARFYLRFLELFHGGPPVEGLPEHLPVLLMAMSLLGAVVCLLAGRGTAPGTERFRALLAPAWGLGPIAAVLMLNLVRPGVHVRYAVAAAPGLALLWAIGAERIRVWLEDRPAPIAILGRSSTAAVAVMAILLAGQLRYHDSLSTKWTRLTERIAADARPGDAVMVANVERPTFDVAWSRLEDPPELASIWHSQPLGTLRRFGTSVPRSDVHWQVAFAERIWAVERTEGSGDNAFEPFIEEIAEPKGFVEAESWSYGGAVLHLLVRPDDPAA